VRQYLAVVRGHLAVKEGTLVHYFRQEGMFQRLTDRSDSGSARAELRYSVERCLRAASLVRVTLVTGLQNQIRVQFSAIGHPVIGDRKYNPAEASERRITRVALHAAHLQFIHPRSGGQRLRGLRTSLGLSVSSSGIRVVQSTGVAEGSSHTVRSRGAIPEHDATPPPAAVSPANRELSRRPSPARSRNAFAEVWPGPTPNWHTLPISGLPDSE
jgi:hypothetical protein